MNKINAHKAHRKLKVYSSNDYQTQGEWKTHLSMEINFVSSKESDEIHRMHTKSDNIDILMGSETNDIVKELFKSLYKNIKKD